MALAQMNRPAILASAAKGITIFMIWATVNTGPFLVGTVVSSENMMWSPERLRALLTLRYAALEWDAVVGVSGNVIQELEYSSVGVFGVGGLLLANLVESYEEIVVNRLGIVEESTNNGLNAVDAFVIEGWSERRFGGILDIGAIDHGSVPVRRNLAFLGVRIIPFEAESDDVVIHGEAAGALSLIPLEVDASIQITLPIFGDVVVLLEDIA